MQRCSYIVIKPEAYQLLRVRTSCYYLSVSLADPTVENRLAEILRAIRTPTISISLLIHAPGIEAQLGGIMAALQDLQTAVARLNSSVSAEIKAVADKLAGLGDAVSSADVENAVAALNKASDTLDAETATLTSGTPAPGPTPTPTPTP